MGGLLRMWGGGKRAASALRKDRFSQIWGAEEEAQHPAAGVRARVRRGEREPRLRARRQREKRVRKKTHLRRLLVFVVPLCEPPLACVLD